MERASFLQTFYDYLSTRTDCPRDFFYPAGLAALSVAAGNDVYTDGWSRPIYCNLWTITIAPSGMGKSVPPDLAMMLLKQADLGDRVLPGSFSQEALWDALDKRKKGSGFFLAEFSAFMGLLSREYNAGLKQWLTDLYDVPETDTRLLKGRDYTLTKPYVSIHGSSAPEWFEEAFKANDLRSGFLARFLFTPSREHGPYVRHPGPHNQGVLAVLSDHLRRVAERYGAADFSAVEDAFDEWDEPNRKRMRDECPPEFSGMRSRAGAQVRKCAMLFHLSRDPSNLRIGRQDLKNAITFVERAHQKAEQFLTEEIASDKDEADRLRIVRILERGEGVVSRELVLKKSKMSAEKLDRAVRTLQESGRVRVERGRGRGTFYALTDEEMERRRPV